MSGVVTGLPTCRPDSGFVVIYFRFFFYVKSDYPVMADLVSRYCPVCPKLVLLFVVEPENSAFSLLVASST